MIASMTQPSPTSDRPPQPGVPPNEPPLPPDPAAYDEPRAELARARGLSAPYIAGGRDPDAEATARRERFYLRLLVLMVVLIVLAGFLLGILSNVLGLGLTE
jgi:hypothetical protein